MPPAEHNYDQLVAIQTLGEVVFVNESLSQELELVVRHLDGVVFLSNHPHRLIQSLLIVLFLRAEM